MRKNKIFLNLDLILSITIALLLFVVIAFLYELKDAIFWCLWFLDLGAVNIVIRSLFSLVFDKQLRFSITYVLLSFGMVISIYICSYYLFSPTYAKFGILQAILISAIPTLTIKIIGLFRKKY